MVKAALVTAWPVVQLASGLSRLIAWLLLPFDRSSRLRMSASSAGLRLAVVAMLAGMSAGTVSFALTSSQASDLEGLAKSGVRSSAIVTRSLPEQHNSVEYSFIVGGRTYSGGGFADPPNPSADHLAPGDSVRIVYQPRNPSDSCACTPASEAPGQRLFPLQMAFFIGLGAAAAYAAGWAAASGRLTETTATSHEAGQGAP